MVNYSIPILIEDVSGVNYSGGVASQFDEICETILQHRIPANVFLLLLHRNYLVGVFISVSPCMRESFGKSTASWFIRSYRACTSRVSGGTC